MYVEQMSRASSVPACKWSEPAVVARGSRGWVRGGGAAEGARSGEAVAHLVRRFNMSGIEALEPRHGVERS